MQISSSMSPSNRTGLQASPVDSKAQLTVPAKLREPRLVADTDPVALRGQYIVDADGLGSVPPPATAKGMAKAGLQALKGNRAQVLIDKVAERLAFERSGARLYEQLILKCEALEGAGTEAPMPPIEGLREIHADEVVHAKLLVEAMQHLGGDPTAQTPSADLVGTESMGLLQTISDPRTTPTQCLHALLTAELTDNAGWELLSMIASEFGQDELAERFERANSHELVHLERVKAWHTAAVLGETSVLAAVGQAVAGKLAEGGADALGNGAAKPRKASPGLDGAEQSPLRTSRAVAKKNAAKTAQSATPPRHPRAKK